MNHYPYALGLRRYAHLIILAALIIALLPITALPTAAQTDESDARPLEGRALENVIAFARLVGYVQYFYPGDEAEATDWNRFTVEGMRAVEDAPDAESLLAILQQGFAPVAPLVQIYPTGDAPDPISAPDNTDDLQLVAWYHRSIQTPDTPHLYRSVRVYKLSQGYTPPGFQEFPDPGTVYSADLGGGVAVTLPIVLWADGDGTLPHTDFAPEDAWPTDIWSYDNRATRLAATALAWNILQHSYPYFDVVDVDWMQVLPDTLQRAATDTGMLAFHDTLLWMLAQLHDGHGGVSVGEWFNDVIEPRQRLPFALAWIEDQAVITTVWPEAEGALQSGDVLLALDDVPITQLMQDQMPYIAASTPQAERLRALHLIAYRPPGTVVVATIQHISGMQEQVHVVADLDPAAYIATMTAGTLYEPRPTDPISELEPGIWYLDMTRALDIDFVKRTAEIYGSAEGLIVDLRGYPVTDGVPMITLLSMLTDRQSCDYLNTNYPRPVLPDQVDMGFEHLMSTTPTNRKSLVAPRIVVMTNARAISFAETLLMEIRHCSDATIIGGPSAGTNGDINMLRLPGDFIIRWTGMAVRWHDGSQFHGIGVLPDVPVERTRQGVIDGRDEVLEAALEIVRE